MKKKKKKVYSNLHTHSTNQVIPWPLLDFDVSDTSLKIDFFFFEKIGVLSRITRTEGKKCLTNCLEISEIAQNDGPQLSPNFRWVCPLGGLIVQSTASDTT